MHGGGGATYPKYCSLGVDGLAFPWVSAAGGY